MQNLKVLSLIILSAISWSGCSNNNAAVAASNSSSSSGTEGISGSGSDMYYEYTTTMAGKNLNLNGYTKLYVSAGGRVRSEMEMINPAIKKDKSGPMVLIASKDKSGQSIQIDDDTRTYTINNIDTASSSDDPFKLVSVVSKAGEETIMGFHCVHARIISTKHMGPLGAQTDTVDLWESPDVPLAPFFRHYLELYHYKSWSSLMTPAAADQLQQMGCTGFLVKMTSGSKDAGVHMELTKVHKDDFPKSMFEIPTGYKEDK